MWILFYSCISRICSTIFPQECKSFWVVISWLSHVCFGIDILTFHKITHLKNFVCYLRNFDCPTRFEIFYIPLLLSIWDRQVLIILDLSLAAVWYRVPLVLPFHARAKLEGSPRTLLPLTYRSSLLLGALDIFPYIFEILSFLIYRVFERFIDVWDV